MSTSPAPASPAELTRRSLLKHAGLALAGVASLPVIGGTRLAAASASPSVPTAPVSSAPPPGAALNRFPRMMHEYLLGRLVAQERTTEAAINALQTRSGAEAFIRDRAAKVRRCFGLLPGRTPLNPRTTGKVERDAYVIEKVIFESRPNFPVTGNLYLPKGGPGPRPAVIGLCGHSENGKAAAPYQSFAQGLARLGYIVLIIDPIGQGERFQCVDAKLRRTHGISTHEHLYVGNQQVLVGEVFATWQAWDGIRAFDYLLTRPEVDGSRIMATGNSGGGTMTTWLCALEPRLSAAAPSCFINTFRRMFESEQPADTEQCPPHTLALGLDHADFFLPFLPRPVILLGQEQDPFDARGLEQSYARLKHLYALVGADQNVALYIGPDGHGFSRANRQAMYGWFNQQTHVATTDQEPALTLEKEETLWCTPEGQVAPLSPRTVVSFTGETARRLARERRPSTGAALTAAVAELLRLPGRLGVPDFRILPAFPRRGYPKRSAGNYAVETEPGIHNLVYRLSDHALVSRPPRGPRRAVLYVSHSSADAELRYEPLVKELVAAEPDAAFYACDVRGLGESLPNLTTFRGFYDPYGSDYMYAIYGTMFDQPYPAQRTFDLLRIFDWLKANGHEEIHLAAKGWGTIPATFAALLDEMVRQVTFKHALASYQAVAEAAEYDWPLSAFIPGVLQFFDLPDCYRALEAKGLRQIDLKGAMSGLT